MKTALAVLLMLHGVAHGVGLAGAWKLLPDAPYKTTIFFGRLDLGDQGIRAMGILWLFAALAVAAAGIVTFIGKEQSWLPFVMAAAIFSAALCTAELPDAKIGLALNIAIIFALLAGNRLGWWA